jgi:hypothetical protein
MPAKRRDEKGRKSTIAGLIALSAATLLMMALAILPSAALADGSEDSSTADAGTSTTTETTTTRSASNPIYTARDAGSACNENGHVIIRASIRNNSDTLSLTVTVTDITFAGESDTAAVPPGETHTFFLDAGPGPLPGGQVAYHVVWDGGQADFTRSHSPTDCPSGSTTTTESSSTTTPGGSTTTTGGSTTTPGGSTTSMTSTTPGGSTTETTASATRVTPPSSSSTTPLGTTVSGTTVSPGETAFTGLENVVPLGTIALVLMTSGAGLMWAGARRRRDDSDDDEG